MRMRGRGIEEEMERGDTRMREGKRAQEKVRKKRREIKEGAWGKAREVEREKREKDRKSAQREEDGGGKTGGEREGKKCLFGKEGLAFFFNYLWIHKIEERVLFLNCDLMTS